MNQFGCSEYQSNALKSFEVTYVGSAGRNILNIAVN